MSGRLLAGVVFAALLLLSGSAPAQMADDAGLAEAERLFDAFQFEAAISVLDPLIDRFDEPGADRTGLLARSYELRGRAAFNLGRARTARSDFIRLLESDASVRLPADASPRLIEFFEAVRAETVGTLFVTMDPPGRLVVDGREILLDALNTVVDVVAGSHTILATLPGHREQRQDVVIAAGQGYSLDIRLDRVYGSLVVATDPPGARVSVDGQYAGDTVPGIRPSDPSVPILIPDLMPGQHQLRLERPCSAPQSVPFNIPDPPVDADIGVIRLEPAIATAIIESPVDGAMVYVDGVLRGRAPARLDDICAGEREIEVRTQRRRFVDRRDWRAGDTVTLRADFRWGFMLLPNGPDAERDNQVLARIEAALQDAQRVLLLSPTPGESDAIAATGGLTSVVTNEFRSVAERRAAGERLADALNVQGVAWVTQSTGAARDAFSLSLLARGSGVPDTLRVHLGDLGSRAAAIRLLSTVVPTIVRPSLGVSLVDVADVEGAAVVRVPIGSAGQVAGLTVGDVVVAVNGIPVTSAGELGRALAARGVGTELSLNVRRTAGSRTVNARVAETPDVVPLVDASRLSNLLLPDMEDAVAVSATALGESAARLNLAVTHIRLQNWDRALRELGRVVLPDGPGVSAGTVSYLTALCLLEVSQLTAAEAALRRAVASEESVLFVGGPRVSPLAQQQLRGLFGQRR